MQIAVFISGAGSNLKALIEQAASDTYEIGLVISNRPNVKGIDIAQAAGIPTEVIDHTLYDSREAFDTAVAQTLQHYPIEAIVLAGFMRILTPEFTENYLGKMLNIHPSLLPKYPGLNTHQRALEAGDAQHGLSIHFVTSELDGGPVVLQAKVPVEAHDTVEKLRQKVQTQEHLAYPLAVTWLAQGRLCYQNHQAWFDGKPLKAPLQLTEMD